jgi:iron complex transport system substrate-binding protein
MKPTSIFARLLPCSLMIAAALAGTCPAACADDLAAAVVDAAGRKVAAGDVSRIVSVGGAVTEILYALGLDQNIVGIDTTSLYPPKAAAEKASIGYMRQLSAEGVLGLRPSLILAMENSGPKDTMAVLEAAKVPLVLVPDTYSEQGIIDKINLIARATDSVDRARCMTAKVRRDLAALAAMKTRIHEKKRVLFVLSFVNGRALVSGRNTAADGIIRLAGGINAIDEYEGYKPLSDEAVIAAKPDAVLAMERAGPGAVTAEAVFANAAFSATPAARSRSFVSMEGLYLLGFGPRTARAGHDLTVALYPNLKVEPLPSERLSASASSCQD